VIGFSIPLGYIRQQGGENFTSNWKRPQATARHGRSSGNTAFSGAQVGIRRAVGVIASDRNVLYFKRYMNMLNRY